MAFHIHIQGLVQGVGFRPLLYRMVMAKRYKGFVCNGNDGVHIEINTTKEEAEEFLKEIIGNIAAKAIIHNCSIYEVPDKKYTSFEIIKSFTDGQPLIPLTPDYALCDDCRKEMNDLATRRYQYPFLTCTQCGPRYSIIHSLPFDRINTTMNSFAMCDECAKEYQQASDRRYYAQTNSCEVCGISLSLYDNQKQIVIKGNSGSLQQTVLLLKKGKIVAVKGIGGYLLMCDATNEKAIQQLRDRKHRLHKPLAVLFSGIEDAQQYCELPDEAIQLLQSPEAPVVLATVKENNLLPMQQIAPGLKSIGIMVPYAPLLELLSKQFGKPLIATSANLSGSPIIYKDGDALNGLTGIADFILTHNREILIPQDDSVVRLMQIKRQPVILRRSRGLSPSYFEYKTISDKATLATGALMKSSFTVSSSGAVYISQYLGSTDSYEAQETYRHTLNHLLDVLQVKPEIIVADRHPQYFSHELAIEFAEKQQTKLIIVQHHKAHFAAVLAENNLLDKENVLGMVWDGTGLGDDEKIWGSEFFIYNNKNMRRCFHLSYYKHLLGDKMAKEPRLSALAVCEGNTFAENLLKEKFSGDEWNLYNNLLKQNNSVQTSSMGRLFDAVASLLNICDKQSFEGQAAMLLETMAQQYVSANGYDFDSAYTILEAGDSISTHLLIDDIVNDIEIGREPSFIAAKFHYSLVKMIEAIAQRIKTKQIAFSGGVFQNIVLMDMLWYHLGREYELFYHKKLSPNDENVSFGQLVYVDNNIDNCRMLNKELNDNPDSYRESGTTEDDSSREVGKQKQILIN